MADCHRTPTLIVSYINSGRPWTWHLGVLEFPESALIHLVLVLRRMS